VTGNLVITSNFAMNYKFNPSVAGQLLKQGLDAQPRCCCPVLDSAPGTPRPRVVISGSVQVATLPVPKQILLLRHQSLPLAQIIKEMNIYSNNEMAEMLAQSLGSAVRTTASGNCR